MTAAVQSLMDGLRQRLLSDAPLMAQLRGPKIVVGSARSTAYPHLMLTEAQARDNGTSSDEGAVITFAIAVMTRSTGMGEGLEIADRVSAVLAAPFPVLTGHRLVNLMVLSVSPEPLKDGETWRTRMAVRAVTETL
jgi:Protein of unknown function (DUF3168)